MYDFSFRCSSLTGRNKHRNSQSIYLSNNCLSNLNVVLHELSHLLGLHHEHQQWDTDNYIKIIWDNVIPLYQAQFYNFNFDTYGVHYDLSSIMQYSLYSFSKDIVRRTSIKVRSNFTYSMAPRGHYLSEGDIKKLNRMYKCPSGMSIDLTVYSSRVQ